MLQFGDAHGRAVTRWVTNFQAVPRAVRGKERVVKQKSRESKTDPMVPF
jgi:hypothetical protein